MKLERILRYLQRVNLEPRFRRRLLGVLALGIFGIFLTVGLVTWGAIAAYQRISNISVTPIAQKQLEGLRGEVAKLPTLNAHNCFESLQTLVDLRPWIANPVFQNLQTLKTACFETKASDCKGLECTTETPSIEQRKRESI